MQAYMLRDSVWEKEVYEGRQKAMAEIERMLGGSSQTSEDVVSRPPSRSPVTTRPDQVGIVYDQFGRPRPAPMDYDSFYSDAPPDEQDEPAGLADDVPFPGLDPPLG